MPRPLHARCVVSEPCPHGGASRTSQRAQVHENIGSQKPLSRSWAGICRWRATPCERPTRMPFTSCTLHQRSATRVRNLRHSNVGCAWRLAEPNPRLWRVVNALFSVSLAADLGAAGACPTGRRPGPQRPCGAGPCPAESAGASGGSDLQRPDRQTPAGPVGTRSAGSADPGRSGRPTASGRIGLHAVESAQPMRSNRPPGCSIGQPRAVL